MGEKIVKTIKGEKHAEKNCRLIEGLYYLVGNNKIEDSGDVYLINGRYIRATTGRVVFDHFEKEYKLKNNTLVEGIIGVNGNELVLGYFTRNDIYNVRVMLKDMSERLAIAPNVLNYAFRERKSDGVFYHISLLEAVKFNVLRGVSREIKESLPYDSKGVIAKTMKIYESNYNPVICSGAQSIGTALKHYTFGLEFETCVGIIPNSKLNFLPLIPLRDGSIDGLEYATVPLQGPKGVQAIIDCVDELKRRTDFNEGCSLHLHIGGMPRTVEFILAFYKMMSYFQDEVFAMFPLYKKYNFDVKRKNYSAPFPFEEINFKMDPIISDRKSILRNFEYLFRYLSGGASFSDYNNDLNNVQFHPQDPDGRQKWNIKHRYSFINFIPLVFGNHQTIEFRIHTPTYSVHKIIDFLALNTFLIDYAAMNYKEILNNTDPMLQRPALGYLIESYYRNYLDGNSKNIYNELIHYVSERKNATRNLTREKGVVYSEKDVRTSRYLKLHTFKFRRALDNTIDTEEPSLSFARFENPFSHEENLDIAMLKARESLKRATDAAAARYKKPNRKDRRSGMAKGFGQPRNDEAVKEPEKAVLDNPWYIQGSDSAVGTSTLSSSNTEPVVIGTAVSGDMVFNVVSGNPATGKASYDYKTYEGWEKLTEDEG